ncbi:MAG: hypothetical protein WDW38_001164 [Sanguina aurantia]
MVAWYQQYSQSNSFNPDSGPSERSGTGLSSDVGILRLIHFAEVGGFTIDPQILIPVGRIYNAKVGGHSLGTASGVGDPILGATLWLVNEPNAGASGRFFGVTYLVTLPLGQYRKGSALDLGGNRYQHDLQSGQTPSRAPTAGDGYLCLLRPRSLTLIVYKKETPPLSNQWARCSRRSPRPTYALPSTSLAPHTLTVDTDTAPFNVPDEAPSFLPPPPPDPSHTPPTPPGIKPLHLLGLYGLSVPDAFDTLTHAADSLFDSVAFSPNVRLTRRAADLSYETALRVLYCTCATDAPVCPCVTTRMTRMAYAFTAAPLGEGAVVSVYEGAGSNGRRRYLLHYTLEHCYRPLQCNPPVDAQFTLDVFPVIQPDA